MIGLVGNQTSFELSNSTEKGKATVVNEEKCKGGEGVATTNDRT